MSNISSGVIASVISNHCINEATINNTHVIPSPTTGQPITFVDHEGVLEDYGQCVYDSTHVSPQSQEKPQNPVTEAIANIVGSQDSKPNGIGSTIEGLLENHSPDSMMMCEMHQGGTCVNMPIHK